MNNIVEVSWSQSLSQSPDFFCEELFEAIAMNMETFFWPIRIRMMYLPARRIKD